MNDYITKFFEELTNFRSLAGGYISPFLPVFEVGAFLLSVVLLIFIVYYVNKSKMFVYRVDEIVDTVFAGEKLLRRRTARGWKRIVGKAKSDDPDDWKTAVLEADKMLGDVLRLSGYKGESVHTLLDAVTPDAVPNIEILKSAHAVAERAIKDSSYALNRTEALEALRMYRVAFKEFDLID